MRRRLAVTALFAALAPLAAQAADPVSLKFASPAPPVSPVNTWGIQPWMEEVQKAAGGNLEIKLFPGPALATFDSAYDRTINGVTEISFGVFGPYAGQFKGTDVGSLPFMTDSDVEASVALWRLFSSGLTAGEFSRVHPLGLFTFPSSGIHTNKEIKTSADLKGLKVGVFSRQGAHELELLGATPITMTPADAYQSQQRGLINATMVGWSAVLPFKLQEVTSFHLEASLGQAPAFIFMNKDAYAKLPAADKKALDGLSYEALSRRMGDVTDRQDELGRSTVGKIPNHKIYKLNPAENAKWEAILRPMIDEYVAQTPNGAAILAAFRKEILNVRAGK
jgi:TRAP-type C4-dicarboxylate transport system substrate-binding protein